MTTNRMMPSTKMKIILSKLKEMTEDKIKSDPNEMIWKLEAIIRNSNKFNSLAANIAIKNKIKEFQTLLPHHKRVFVLEGMFLERTASHKEAFFAYRAAREKFPFCWHAYLYPAAILQSVGRYHDSKKMLDMMLDQIKIAPQEEQPTKKLVKEAHLLSDKAISMQVQSQLRKEEQQKRHYGKPKKERELTAKRQNEYRFGQERQQIQERQIRIDVKQQRRTEEAQRKREWEAERNSPTYNMFNVLRNEETIPLESSANTANAYSANNRHYGRLFSAKRPTPNNHVSPDAEFKSRYGKKSEY